LRRGHIFFEWNKCLWLTSFSSQRNSYLFPKYRVAHIWAERFRYGYTPWYCNFKVILTIS
jgi:hypothetical protein